MFENHLPDRTVIKVEVEGEREVCVRIHQAIKYRSLAAADAGYPLLTSRVRSLVVAYSIDNAKARELADRYDIPLMSVSREKILTGHGSPACIATTEQMFRTRDHAATRAATALAEQAHLRRPVRLDARRPAQTSPHSCTSTDALRLNEADVRQI
jgi:hypothetical protein